jgi:hypothetical protein
MGAGGRVGWAGMSILIHAFYPTRIRPPGTVNFLGRIAQECGGSSRGDPESGTSSETIESHCFSEWESVVNFLRRSHKLASDHKASIRFDVRIE